MGACLQAKGRQSRPAGYQRPGFSGVRCSVSETRCNGGAFRDRSSHPWPLSFCHPWPNRSLQAPPLPRSLCSGTATGHNTPRPSKEERLGISQGAPGSGVPIQDRIWPGMAKSELTGMYLQRVLDGHTRSRCGLSGEKGLWNPTGASPLSRAGPAPTRPGPQTRVPGWRENPAERKNPPFRRAFRWGLARGNQLSSPGSSNGMETVAAPPST